VIKTVYLLTIGGYVCLLWLTGGIYVTRKSRSSEAYLVASRGLSIPFISVLIAGTWIGGVSIVGMAQGAYIHGIRGKKTYSILDVVGSLYDKKTTKLAGILQLIFCLILLPLPINCLVH
jgi:Na+/proline symporter